MSDVAEEKKKRFKFPTAFTILFVLIAVVAAATWVIPAGEYETEFNEALGRDVPIPGTYHEVEPNPQGIFDVILAPIAGMYDPESYEANAIDVALFVLVIGGFLGVVTKTGAIDAGIARVITGLKGREKWMIPILMALFAAGGTSYGMAEATLAVTFTELDARVRVDCVDRTQYKLTRRAVPVIEGSVCYPYTELRRI